MNRPIIDNSKPYSYKKEEKADDLEGRSIVIDNGSYNTKVGFAGDDKPSLVPTVTGRGRNVGVIVGTGFKYDYIGEEALAKRQILTLRRPYLEKIGDWDLMEKIWEYIFKDHLRVDPSEHPILMTEVLSTPRTGKVDKMAEVLFENFDVPSYYMANQAGLSMMGAGKTTGLSVSFGHHSTRVVPVIEGCSIFEYGLSNNTGGDTITEYLCNLFTSKGFEIWSSADRWAIRDELKEKKSFVAFDFEKEMAKNHSTFEFKPPEGDDTYIYSKELYQCPEVLFKPALLPDRSTNLIETSVQELIEGVIEKSPKELTHTLLRNIVFEGGTSILPGLSERLKKEVSNIFLKRPNFERPEAKAFSILSKEKDSLISKIPNDLKDLTLNNYVDLVTVIQTPESKYLPWKGGSMLASRNDIGTFFLTKERYNEVGYEIGAKYFM